MSSVAPRPIRRRSSGGRDPRRKCLFAIMAVFAMLAVALAPLGSGDSEADDAYWTYTVTTDGTVTGSSGTIAGFQAPIKSGMYNKGTEGYNTGAWGFDAQGYGPFGSFYAAFDACHGNLMICHLDPNDLSKSVDNSISLSSYSSHTVNIMWVLPTVYWKVDGNGSLVMTNNPNAGGEAYAHTIDGDVHEYLAIGVYESSTATVGKDTVLTSTTDSLPLIDKTREDFREYANNNMVATADGITPNGHAMLWNLYAYQLYRFCVLTVGGSWDSQGTFGNGDCYGNHTGPYRNRTGTLDLAGPYAGTVGAFDLNDFSDENYTYTSKYYSSMVKAFIENPWGSLRQFVDGVLTGNGEKWDTYYMYASQAAVPTDSISDYEKKVEISRVGDKFATTSADSSTYPGFWGWPTAEATSQDSGLYDKVNASNVNLNPGIITVGGNSFNVYKLDESISKNLSAIGLSCMELNSSVNESGSYVTGRLSFVFDGESKATVEYDHSGLRALLQQNGLDTDVVDTLSTGMKISGNDRYEDLGYVLGEDGFKHVGWIIDGKQYPANHTFIKRTTHTAKSVWVGLPAVTYNHDELIKLSGDPDSVAGLSNGLEITGNTRYEQLPDRAGCTHTGWRIVIGEKTVEVGPTATFESRLSHTAYSLWKAVPTVIFDHTNLTSIVGPDADGVSDLRYSMTIQGNPNYPKLPDTAGYRHTGWEIDGTTVGTTASLVKETTHTAKSLWEKISDSARPIPIIPDQEEDTIEVVIEKGSEPWLGKDAKNVLLIAIVVAIIAELAVLSISRRR